MMHQLPQDHIIPDEEEDIEEEIWFTVPERMVGYAIGKNGQTKNRIMEKTNTHIKTKRNEDNETYFIIRGTRENQYSAKLFIKETVNTGIRRNLGLKTIRFPLIDSNSGEFKLKRVEKTDNRRSPKEFFELALRDSTGDRAGNTDYSFLSEQIFQILRENKKTDRASKIWCHFGHIYVTNVKPDEEDDAYSPLDLNNHLMPRWFCQGDIPEVTKWQHRFFGYIQNQDQETFFSQLQRWMSTQRETNPFLTFHRYEFTYLTPSCRELRIKVFVQVKPHDSDQAKFAFENAPSPVDVKNVLKQSYTYPYFYVCESTAKRAVVDILEPSGPDIRLIAEANLTSGPEDEELREEVEILYNYVRQNLIITQDGKVNLLQRSVPEDFDLHYSRMSERKLYTVTSDDDEQFNVIICYESPRDIKKGDYNDTKNSVDIHLFYHDWEDKFKSNNWDPQEIVDKIPRFMACARSLARSLMVDNTPPPEIIARGPKARRAYQVALESGKTKNLRVPVMLVGQSRAGKTSLLRSLRRDKFDPNEDSTEGVTLHRSISKAKEEIWKEDEAIDENSFYDCAAKAMAENLTAPTSGTESSSQEDNDDTLNIPTYEEDVHQVPDILNPGNGKSEDVSDVTEEPFKESPELTIQEKQETAPENFSENPMPEEVIEKATYMLQNLNSLENDECIQLMTMDFAGQPVYQATHPVFLSPKGIYILVHSLKNDVHDLARPMVKRGSLEPRKIDDNCPMTNMDHLEFWLSFVASNATTTDDEPSKLQGFKLPKKFPPVFLVCTHADETFEKQDSEHSSQRILDQLKRKEDPSGQHLVHAIYPVDNTVSGGSEKQENEYVKKLREDIRVTAEHLPQVGEDIPIRWLKFEKELSEIEQKRYITLEEAKNIARKCQVDLESDELDTLLNYLHDLKVIIYFEGTNMIIIDTQWLLDMFVKVITVQPFLKWEPRFEDCWRKLENEGVLEKALVGHLWSDLADEQNTIDVLLTVMEKFSLLCRWRRLDESEVFLVPAMLLNSAPEEFNQLLIDPQLPIPLVIRFTTAHLPLGIFPRILVAIIELCNKKWPESRLPKFSHNFCRFFNVGMKKGWRFDLLVTSDVRTITFGVTPITKNDINVIMEFCQLIKNFLFKTLQDMRTDCPWMRAMDFEFGIRCPICTTSPKPCSCHRTKACMRDTCAHFIPEKELPRCYNDPTNRKTLIDEESYFHWFPTTAEDPIEPEICGLMEALNLTGNTSLPGGKTNQEVVNICGTEVSKRNVDAESFAAILADKLNLDKVSMQDPPEKTIENCRKMCIYLKKEGMVDIIKELRKKLPSGMTGPLRNENAQVQDMIGELEDLTRALCGNDMWKKLAEHLDIRRCHFDFYGKEKNPAESILEEVCRKRKLTVVDLYDVLCECGANALADQFL